MATERKRNREIENIERQQLQQQRKERKEKKTEWNSIKYRKRVGNNGTKNVCYRREICHWQCDLNGHLTNLQKLTHSERERERKALTGNQKRDGNESFCCSGFAFNAHSK